MTGRVTTSLLNIRSEPHIRGRKIGTLPLNAIVNFVGFINDWMEIKYGSGTAFIHGDYVDRVHSIKKVKGKVRPKLLNVRSKPSLTGDVTGTISQHVVIDIIAESGDWLEIVFNNQPAFIHGDFIDRIEIERLKTGYVNTAALNIRNQPDLSGGKIGSLKREASVEIISKIGKWYEIKFSDSTGYVHSDYIDFPREETQPRHYWQGEELRNIGLEPEGKITVKQSMSREQKVAARSWNNYGKFLQHLAYAIGIDIGCAIAVICVESGGNGFGRDMRMIIRFENHQFWKWWGKYHPNAFNQHFKFSSNKIWQGHKFYDQSSSKWISFHNSQNKEWKVFEAARQVDDTASLKSISMGAPQIMGFNYKKIGYETVQHMFNNFSQDIRFHLLGLFDFFDNSMIQALKKYKFENFAKHYNGPGQAQAYGSRMQEHYEAFGEIKVS